MRRAGLLLSLLLLGCTSLLAQGNDVVIKAMKDEMARSIGKLRLSELDKPYFIVYRVADTKDFTISATLGALTQSQTNKGRKLTVDVKVGDYALDNTNFVNTKEIGMRMASLGSNFSTVTLDDDYLQVRRALWRSTDREYKDAAEKLAAKRSVLQNRQGTKMLPDFEKASPVESLEPRTEMKIDVAALEALVRKASAQFKADPNVLNSAVGIVIRQQYVRYLNSEGTLMTFNEPMVTFAASASTQAKDGTPLSDTMMRFASSVDDLDEAKLMKEVKTLADRLSGLRTVVCPPAARRRRE